MSDDGVRYISGVLKLGPFETVFDNIVWTPETDPLEWEVEIPLLSETSFSFIRGPVIYSLVFRFCGDVRESRFDKRGAGYPVFLYSRIKTA